ncbi:unnamed protein product [Plutella xylostella]|uniref:(diamondback moth) hypothetical protein n=1 Tax=Plutella xylostella TaxID=51655 RepID=A0A8S4F532_PLUXY|nr:unnamed protein product [Plutella xylostella]
MEESLHMSKIHGTPSYPESGPTFNDSCCLVIDIPKVATILGIYRHYKSTEDAVVLLSDLVSQYLDSGNGCIGVFLDLAKAFDTFSSKILLSKLQQFGIREKIIHEGSMLRLVCVARRSTEPPSYVFCYFENRMINYDLKYALSDKPAYYTLSLLLCTLGESEKIIHEGSMLRLVCVARRSTEPPSYVFCYFENRIINYDLTTTCRRLPVRDRSQLSAVYCTLSLLLCTLGESEKIIHEGSMLRLVCVARRSTEPPSYVFWYFENRIINYDLKGCLHEIAFSDKPAYRALSLLLCTLGESEKIIHEGSMLRLVCVARRSTEPPSYVFCYFENRMINYDLSECF